MMILNITLVHTQKPKLHSSSGIPTLHSLHPDLPPWIVCVSLKIKSGSWLEKFIAEAKDKSPEDRAKLIEESDDLLDMHEENATVDDTPLTESSFESHFIAFVIVDGKLWELDGRKPQPICHGPSEDVLKDSVSVIKNDFIPHIENPMEISVCAFCGASS